MWWLLWGADRWTQDSYLVVRCIWLAVGVALVIGAILIGSTKAIAISALIVVYSVLLLFKTVSMRRGVGRAPIQPE